MDQPTVSSRKIFGRSYQSSRNPNYCQPTLTVNKRSITSSTQNLTKQDSLQRRSRIANDLIRRATYDLTGLPPTPAEVDDFSEAYSKQPDQAWAALIDRLLDSPRYGEHWARHWLDVTRYADTGGMSNDFERSNMWRYRDYVIRAFNSRQAVQRIHRRATCR